MGLFDGDYDRTDKVNDFTVPLDPNIQVTASFEKTNSNGDKITTYIENGKKAREVVTSADGKTTKIARYQDDQITSGTVFSTDENGQSIRDEYTYDNDKITSVKRYFLDEYGNVTKTKDYSKDEIEYVDGAWRIKNSTSSESSNSLEAHPVVEDELIDENNIFAIPTLKDETFKEGYYYDENDVEYLKKHINKLYENHVGIARKSINDALNLFSSLLKETQNQLSSIDSYIAEMLSKVNSYDGTLQTIGSHVKWSDEKMNETSYEKSKNKTGKISGIHSNHSSGDIDTSTESATTETVTETPVEVVMENPTLVAAAVGAVTFTEIVPLFTTLGSETTESSSTTTTYALIGVEKYNGNYYYKIIDRTTGKIYYVEKNNKVNVDGQTEVLDVKNTTVRYNTTQLDNEDNGAKLITEGTYLVTGKETVEDVGTFEFAKVLDSTDGNNYYFMLNDNVEVTSLEELGSESVG